ncbi:MAG: ribonuclease PH [Mariprofundaceae bacterium]|nr:ribonuclease PH [Mariprofundaceae bacterium]
MRNNRKANELRPVRIETGVNRYAEGSVQISFGHTRVLCMASVEEKQPPFLRNTNQGWVTAEYGMLPRATHTRGGREATRGKQTGRTIEIQRLIGRSLRAIIDLQQLGKHTITVDCDVLQADGGTRTAAITASWVAVRLAVNRMLAEGMIESDPLYGQVAAISCGFVQEQALLDLQYSEDSKATMDANFVMTGDGDIIEVQATAEEKPVPWHDFMALKTLADQGVMSLIQLQKSAIEHGVALG